MRNRIIIPEDLEKYMGESSYKKFIKDLSKTMKVKKNESIFIIAEICKTGIYT